MIDPFHVNHEVNRRHDSIPKLLLDDFLEGQSVYEIDLVESIDARILWRRTSDSIKICFVVGSFIPKTSTSFSAHFSSMEFSPRQHDATFSMKRRLVQQN
jgi:hypothetical protein